MMTHTFDASAWETAADSEFQANISLKQEIVTSCPQSFISTS